MSIDTGLHLTNTTKLEQTHFPSAREHDIFGTLKIQDTGGSVTLFICPHRAESAGVEFLDALVKEAEGLKHWLLFGDAPQEPAELPAAVVNEELVEQWYSCEDPRYGQTHLWSEKVRKEEAHGVTVQRQCQDHLDNEKEENPTNA